MSTKYGNYDKRNVLFAWYDVVCKARKSTYERMRREDGVKHLLNLKEKRQLQNI